MAETTPDRLVAALTAAGWVEEGRVRGYVRMRYGTHEPSLLVPLDPLAPEHGQLFTAALTTLKRLAEIGAAARLALGMTSEHITVYPGNARLYGVCDTCGVPRWETERYLGDGAGQAPVRATHCACCTHPHDLAPGGHELSEPSGRMD